LLFAIISSLIILYASGYEINWQHLLTPLGVQKTGMIIIHSEPSGADIFLNNKKGRAPQRMIRGSSAVFERKTRRFPPLLEEGLALPRIRLLRSNF